ncbi:MAG: MiaB/RimO family radical SAM methylthiotransferase [Clostridia bacterium]|nr:MiaB/RimO family radical SAM methylthiotransferase [Clostridia bacterium]
MKAVIFTLGCKVNEVESASIMAALEELGFEVSAELSFADLYVLNTCAVTREAEKKSRQLIARVKKYNPDAKIFVCGCASEKDENQFIEKGVTFVCGARKKEQIISAVRESYLIEGECENDLPFPKQVKTRAFIKISDGCNNFCSYCIIPYLRGRVTSRSIEDIMGEIEKISCPEIVLTGINISAYNYEGKTLCDLIEALSNVDKRIRLGSIECRVITPEFLMACRGLKDFAPQFHLSLQSGSNKILQKMNRKYTREEYLSKCKLIYDYFPQAAITTDIIVGFCGEEEEDFNQSLSIINEARFARVHAFAFSPREGTAAFKMKDVHPEVKAQRLHALIVEAKSAEERYITAASGGDVLSFIAEEYDGEYTTGYTQNYIKVYVPMKIAEGSKCDVVIIKLYKDGAIAEIF